MSGARHIQHHRAPLGTAQHLHPRFHAVLVVSNTRRWRTRYELANDAIAHLRAQGTEPWVIECAYGRRGFALTDANSPRHIQVRTPHEIWHKEALVNIAASRLPHDWLYMAWIDADVTFVRPDIVNETVQMLQHHRIVQMWEEAHDVGPDYQLLAKHESFAASLYKHRDRRRCGGQGGYYYGAPSGPRGSQVYHWHPGFAWAIRRDTFDDLGRLIDYAALGAGDNHMAWAIAEDVMRSVHPRATDGYKRALLEWENRCRKHVRRDLGFVRGTLLHHWHGKKVDRKYWDRWRILVDNGFDPNVDLKPDWQGLPQLVDRGGRRSVGLRDRIREYMVGRNEDSIDIE